MALQRELLIGSEHLNSTNHVVRQIWEAQGIVIPRTPVADAAISVGGTSSAVQISYYYAGKFYDVDMLWVWKE